MSLCLIPIHFHLFSSPLLLSYEVLNQYSHHKVLDFTSVRKCRLNNSEKQTITCQTLFTLLGISDLISGGLEVQANCILQIASPLNVFFVFFFFVSHVIGDLVDKETR